MKFTDGNWLIQKDVKAHYPCEVYDTEISENNLTIYCPDLHIEHRGNTLDGQLLTLRFSSPMPDVIRARMTHFEGITVDVPQFEIHEENDAKVEIYEDESKAILNSGRLGVHIHKKNPFTIDFIAEGKVITGSGYKRMGYMEKQNQGAFMATQLNLGVGECVYGLGERFTPFVKNGQVVDIWNEDGGTSSQQAYKNIPFYITNRGYGVFVNHPGCVSFEVATERVSKVQFSVPGECLEYFIIYGPTPKEILEKYTALTGRPSLPPAWSFGLWLTTSFTTNYDEETVTGIINGMAERDLPLSVFHFDCFWMKEYHWCDFEWDKRVFPEPEEMLRRLKEKGLKICVWINPYIAQRSKLFEEGRKNGYLLKRPNGDVWQWDKWQAGMGVVDFTNPEACEWYAGKLRALMDMGVDCFKTDFGERIPTDVVYHDGSDPVRMHNYYTYLYNKLVFEVMKEKVGEREAAVFARSATVGSQKFPVHWGGDCSAEYESMAESLRGGLSLCMSGFGFWSHDISGFENTATPDIYKRWVAFGMLSSHSRLHGNSSYRVPWLFDEEAVDVLRFFTKLKCRLMPYLFKTACEAAQRGIPMMRAMVMEFIGDPACDYLDRQYMLGDSLLVAPIFSEDGSVSYYLPNGRWTNFLTGEKIEGGLWRQEKHDYLSIPLMVRPNTIIAVGDEDGRPDYDYAGNVTLHVFELQDGCSASTTVYNTQGGAELSVTVRRDHQTVTIEAEGTGKKYNVLFRGIQEAKAIEKASIQVEEKGVRVLPEAYTGKITLQLA